jgi:hypothetical protein
MKAKLICTGILALAASFSAVAQDAAADLNDPAVLCRVMVCKKSFSTSEAAPSKSMQVLQQRRLLSMKQARPAL